MRCVPQAKLRRFGSSLAVSPPDLHRLTRRCAGRVPMPVIHRFTFSQVLCLVVLWMIKISLLGILCPRFVAMLVPTRYGLNYLFKIDYLNTPDAEEEPEDESERWAASPGPPVRCAGS